MREQDLEPALHRSFMKGQELDSALMVPSFPNSDSSPTGVTKCKLTYMSQTETAW
jgi:hypothetical protein